MRVSSKIAGLALVLFLGSMPFLAEFHSEPKVDPSAKALRDFYDQVFVVPSAMREKSNRTQVLPCLLGAKCSEIYTDPVLPCLLGDRGCNDEVRPMLLSLELSFY